MSDFASSSKIPMWRFVFWGALAVGAFAWIAHAFGDRGIMLAGVIGVPVVIIVMLGIIRLARTEWTRRRLGLLLFIYAILQTVLLAWSFLGRR